jgi:NADH dehydrogenase
MESAPKPKPHVVIVGAGFGGLEAAKLLINEPVRMTVIDRTNHHLFQPLLYQIATAALSPADMRRRSVESWANKNTEVILAEVKRSTSKRGRIIGDGAATII